MVSTLVFESRRDEGEADPRIPKGSFEKAFLDTEDLWYNLELGAKHYKLKRSAELDLTVAYAINRWVSGKTLDSVLFESDMLVGDFIRLCKQIIDLLEQIARAADGKLRNTAIDSIDLMKRGIVAYSYYA